MIRVSRWESCVIAVNRTLSTVCNLGRPYEYAVVQVPAIDAGTLDVRASRTATGPGVDLYIAYKGAVEPIAVGSGAGNFMWMIPLYGVQYLWFYTSVAQASNAVTFYVRGFNGAVRTN